ncbi:MAG: Asp23/Gls24 family envelope stress response protein [Lachnospiraceae bacterium]|nr:Asp23/Gls24 family envelope stress response protein [Lachnospiraceae bacterium]
MAESRSTYTIKEDGGIGTVKIADEVVAVIAGLAATEVKGVSSLAGGITNAAVARKGIKALSRGVKINVTENHVSAELSVNLEFGYSIPEVAEQVQQKVKSAIETMTGMQVTEVNISVADVEVESGE